MTLLDGKPLVPDDIADRDYAQKTAQAKQAKQRWGTDIVLGIENLAQCLNDISDLGGLVWTIEPRPGGDYLVVWYRVE